jgi:ferric-dicitrate binding protein FerR (iron transport regulator)
MLRHAERRLIVEEAKDIVGQLQFRDYPFLAEMEEVRDALQRARQLTRKANRRVKVLQLYRWAAVAATVIFVTGAWWFFQRPVSRSGTTASLGKSITADTRPAQGAIVWRTQTNTGRKAARLLLADSSVVTLYSSSTIQYPEPFAGDKREVRLTGDAVFEVAKDRRRPFTVYSRMLSVTALGTSFRVIATNEKKESVTVKLFTGKVQILPRGSLYNWKADEAVILLPGEQMEFNRSHRMVTRFRPAGATPNGTNFSDTPLPIVMKALSALYKIKIDYNPSDIAEINFTGAIDKGDELKAVLQAIAQMNGLRIIQTDEGYSVIRPGK